MQVLTLSVVSYNGSPLTTALSARMDELGGTIGRADSNQLVLPDPDRTVSRVHARIGFRREGFVLTDCGSNPVTINGKVIGNGNDHLLADADRIDIGAYEIRCQLSTGRTQAIASSSDPFADLLGPAAAPARADFDPLMQPARPVPAPARSSDPLQTAGGGGQAGAFGGIPDDWDPFAPQSPASMSPGLDLHPASGVGLPAQTPLVVDLGQSGHAESIDELFSLGAAGAGSDPLGSGPFADVVHAPNTSGHADPLRALERLPLASAQTVGESGDLLHESFAPPKLESSPLMAGPPATSRQDQALATPGFELSGDYTQIAPSKRPAASPVMPAPVPLTGPAQGAPQGSASVAASPPVPTDDLLAALLRGLGQAELPVHTLTPELMHKLGAIVREAAAGTVELLLARASVKQAVRAEVTMIASTRNNPLKFSPGTEVALQHLLGPKTRGFMEGPDAMRDAWQDLRAHQFGMVAGMRAALEGVLGRFAPEHLESQLSKRSLLHNLLPASRKAQLWDLYQQHFGNIRNEAEDDFQTLFGKAFLAAYEADLDSQAAKGGPQDR